MFATIISFILKLVGLFINRPSSTSTADIQHGADAAINKMQSDILDKADEQAKEAVVDRGGASGVLGRLSKRKQRQAGDQ